MRRLATLFAALLLVLSLPAGAAKKKRRAARPQKPIAVYTKGGQPNIQAQAAVVVDLEGGAELFQKNPDEIRPIASISKHSSRCCAARCR